MKKKSKRIKEKPYTDLDYRLDLSEEYIEVSKIGLEAGRNHLLLEANVNLFRIIQQLDELIKQKKKN